MTTNTILETLLLAWVNGGAASWQGTLVPVPSGAALTVCEIYGERRCHGLQIGAVKANDISRTFSP